MARQERSLAEEEAELAAALAASTHDAELMAAMEASKQEYQRNASRRSGAASQSFPQSLSQSFVPLPCSGNPGDDLAAAIAASLEENQFWKPGAEGTGTAVPQLCDGAAVAAADTRRGRSETQSNFVELLSSDDDDDGSNGGGAGDNGAGGGGNGSTAPASSVAHWRCDTCTFGGNSESALECELCATGRVL